MFFRWTILKSAAGWIALVIMKHAIKTKTIMTIITKEWFIKEKCYIWGNLFWDSFVTLDIIVETVNIQYFSVFVTADENSQKYLF